jgi:hypothetical protein
MKFACLCGSVIHDNTDYQEDKAYFIPDQSYERAVTLIRSERSAWEELRKVERTMYQCRSCARLWLEDHEKNLCCFTPEPSIQFGILKESPSE